MFQAISYLMVQISERLLIHNPIEVSESKAHSALLQLRWSKGEHNLREN